MKTSTKKWMMAAMMLPAMASAQDLEIQNLDDNWGFDYNENTGVISNLFFKPAEGDGTDITDDFVIAVFIENQDNDERTELARQTVEGIPSFNAITADNWGNINLNDYDLPEGSYLVFASVDTDDDISETDEGDNEMYLALSADDAFDFTPSGGSTGVDQASVPDAGVVFYPNPFRDVVTIDVFNHAPYYEMTVRDLPGRKVYSEVISGNTRAQVNFSFLPQGTYVYELRFADGHIASGRLLH